LVDVGRIPWSKNLFVPQNGHPDNDCGSWNKKRR